MRTEEEGIDLIFNKVELIVICRYSKYVYTADEDGDPIGCPCEHVETLLLSRDDGINDVNNLQSLVVSGGMFQFNNLVLTIMSVASDEVIAEVVTPSTRRGEKITFTDKNEVSRLIVAYNSSS